MNKSRIFLVLFGLASLYFSYDFFTIGGARLNFTNAPLAFLFFILPGLLLIVEGLRKTPLDPRTTDSKQLMRYVFIAVITIALFYVALFSSINPA